MIIGIATADGISGFRSPTGEDVWGGAGWARLGQYIPYLKAAGHSVYTGILWKNGDISALQVSPDAFVTPDVFILQRLMHDTIDTTMRTSQKHGQIFVNDIDDLYWGLDSRNQAYLASHPKHNPTENTHFYWNNVKTSDVVTVSTPFLRDYMLARGYKGKVVVLPNTIDTVRFSPVTQKSTPTFGWVGSTQHRSGDIELLRGIFPKYIRSGALTLHHSGDGDDAPKFADMIGVPIMDVSTQPRTTTTDYPSLLTMDVGLVPLRYCDFNRAKSDIKGLEYAAAGIPFISSDIDSYASLHKDWNGQGFLLAEKSKHWFRAIDTMLDIGIRTEYQAALLELVKQRDIALGAKNLIGFLESL